MNAKVVWKENMKFDAVAGDKSVVLDAKTPVGRGEGMTPKELVALGLVGCMAMDVSALMKKHKQPVESFEVHTNIETTPTGVHPAVFVGASVVFEMKGAVDSEKLKEAVVLSQTKYCGVSAMLAKAFPIQYKILLNGEEIATGSAQF